MTDRQPFEEIPASLLVSFREEATELLADLEEALLELEERPGDLDLVARAFRALHTIKGNSAMFGLERLEALSHELEHVFDLVRKGRIPATGEIVSLGLAAKDRLLALLDERGEGGEEARLRGGISSRIAALLGTDSPTARRSAPARHVETEAAHAAAGGDQEHDALPGPGAATERETGTLRVPAARLDDLVNLVGELVTVQARLSRQAELEGGQRLTVVAEEVERLTAGLRDLALGIRMVPVRPAFGKFRRLVRDLARDIGREVEFVTAGEETELDKSVIDRLGDPIVHILRNSIGHGIESPEERERAGKPRRGRVRLTASQAGASVVIRVEDDGRGVDLAAVRRKALRHGLLGESEDRDERGLLALLFAPGFSTSPTVTNVSGRGVGLDVVKRAVEALRGSVRVESCKGAGTSFEVRLPLTLAIIEGLAVAVGEERFIIPLAAVQECVETGGGGLQEARRRVADVLEVRGEALPFVRLREWFGVAGEPPARGPVVIAEAGGRRVGLLVDEVFGEQQTVIKPLGRLIGRVRGFAGSTILGDGTVALILDVEELAGSVESTRGAAAGR